MSTFAQNLTIITPEAYRALKAQALTVALSTCRTPTEALRFLSVKVTELQQLQRVTEAALRAGL